MTKDKFTSLRRLGAILLASPLLFVLAYVAFFWKLGEKIAAFMQYAIDGERK